MKKILISLLAFVWIAIGVNAQTQKGLYFSEDFEWLEPWSAVGYGTIPAADIVGTDQAETEQPQISSAKCLIDGKKPSDELAARGYEFLRWANATPTPGECIYLQRNYLKFGKTGYQGGMTLPAMESLGEGVEGLTLSFDWYSQRQASGIFDPTELVVIVKTGDEESKFSVPKLDFVNGATAKWTKAIIKLEGVKLDKDSRITIRNIDSQLRSAKALRWHIDNIYLFGEDYSNSEKPNVNLSENDFIHEGIIYTIIDKELKTCRTKAGYMESDPIEGSVQRPGNYVTGSVTIPSTVLNGEEVYTVVEIGNEGFYNCAGLESITISDGIVSIGGNAFNGCAALQTVTLGATMKKILTTAFSYCSALTTINIPASIKEIGTFAFVGCNNLKDVIIEDLKAFCEIDFKFLNSNSQSDYGACNPVLHSGRIVMDGNEVTELVIPEGVETLTDYLFQNCRSLTSVSFPSSLKSVAQYAFYQCTGLTKVITTCMEDWCDINFGNYYSNPLFYAESLYIGENKVEAIVIPESVTDIKDLTFYHLKTPDCFKLKLPSNLKSIGEYAFCTSESKASTIEELEVPESVETIGYSAFGNRYVSVIKINNLSKWCNILFENATANPLYRASSIWVEGNEISAWEIPEDITEIKPYAFYSHCEKITDLKLNDNIKTIGTYAFGCNKIEKLTIPSSVESIGNSAFAYCPVKELYVGSGIKNIGNYSFHFVYDNNFVAASQLEKVTIESTEVPETYAYAFNPDHDHSNTMLYVHPTAVNDYKNHQVWGKFNVQSYQPTAVETISEDAQPIGIYDMQGQFVGADVNALEKGAFIVIYSNGNRRKIMK